MKLIGKTLFWCTIALVVIVIYSLVTGYLERWLAAQLGIEHSSISWISSAILLLFLLVPKRFMRFRRDHTLNGEIVINAPIDVVWDAIAPRARTDPFLSSYSEIRAADAEGQVFDYVFKEECRPNTGHEVIRQTVIDAQAPNLLVQSAENENDVGGLGIGPAVSTYSLRETEAGTHVNFVEVIAYVSFWYLVMRLFVNPSQDMLGALKSFSEGRTDESWMAKRIHDATVQNGSGTNRTILIVGLTTLSYMAVLAYLVYWLAGLNSGG